MSEGTEKTARVNIAQKPMQTKGIAEKLQKKNEKGRLAHTETSF